MTTGIKKTVSLGCLSRALMKKNRISRALKVECEKIKILPLCFMAFPSEN